MKKFLPVLFILLMVTGCADFERWVEGSSPGMSVDPRTPEQQLAESRASFEKKINTSKGMPLGALRSKWGSLEPGLSRDNLTVYRWSQTTHLTNPNPKVKVTSSTASCLAMFIVDPKGIVVDAASEGQCYDYRLLRSWKPIVTQSTDGRTGIVY